MGICFSNNEEEKLNEKISNGKITKVYNFNNMNLDSLKIDEDQIIEKINVFSASNNNLFSLENTIFSKEKIKKIIKIDFSFNKFLNIPNEIFKFSDSLKILNFSNNKIINISNNIQNLKNLKELYLNNNKIKNFPSEFFNLNLLNNLDLSNNEINIFNEEFILIKNLTFLNLSKNKIEILPEKNWNKSNLIHLDLSYNLIKNIPNEMLENSKITLLNLKGNLITKSKLRDLKGFEIFSERRKRLKDQGFKYDLDMTFSFCGLD